MEREVGVRELKNEASAVIRTVEGGDEVVVTRNGRPVARLIPEGMPAGITDLIRAGSLSWNGRRLQPVERIIATGPGEPTLADTVIADRGPR